MADNNTPTELRPDAGVRRLNKMPIAVIAVALILISGILIWAITQRGRHGSAAKPNDTQLGNIQEDKNTQLKLTKDAPMAGMIAAAPAPISRPPDLSGPVAGMIGEDTPARPAAASTGAKSAKPTIAQSNAAGGVPPAPPQLTPMEQEAERMRQAELQEERRIRQRKQQFYEQALISPTRIGGINTNRQGNTPNAPAGSMVNFNTTQSGANHPPVMLPSALDLQKALSGMQGGAGGGGGDDQSSKEAFLAKERTQGYLVATKQAQLSKYELKTGTVIPAVLITGINSDLPGEILAQVSQNVYDTATGKFLLIPQGAKLYGAYDSRVVFGQKRVLQVWTRLIFPDGSTLDLQSMAGQDQSGYTGFKDKVNNHYVQLFGSALLMSLFSAGIQLSQPQSNNPYQAPTAGQTIAGSVGQQMGQVGTQLMQRQMNVQPTLTIRPGYQFNVMVNKDIILEPISASTQTN